MERGWRRGREEVERGWRGERWIWQELEGRVKSEYSQLIKLYSKKKQVMDQLVHSPSSIFMKGA